ncbi:hypothetical protein SARC_03473 [Sphaeroforma arctica JP610]|uniref:Uncharacterized protein n=1 Tax=Sphaeroforma arctica JP610 TaxID=667725 RepID=A0A0L0G5J7_9EUKA|nr:hypothetical protein SARC_03473 [Sphaeroforma arctica JP610]KNC84312.1 hypothetical protein SARC_03473 [Sphaeroforma arctica JP610]|eukprot:XP_014158214.1 hypothetical protein SARC_03473 [Sphaeroforma arctica JP610]
MGGISKVAESLRNSLDNAKARKQQPVGSLALVNKDQALKGRTKKYGGGGSYSGCFYYEAIDHRKYLCPAWKKARATALKKKVAEDQQVQPSFPPFTKAGPVEGFWSYNAHPPVGAVGVMSKGGEVTAVSGATGGQSTKKRGLGAEVTRVPGVAKVW